MLPLPLLSYGPATVPPPAPATAGFLGPLPSFRGGGGPGVAPGPDPVSCPGWLWLWLCGADLGSGPALAAVAVEPWDEGDDDPPGLIVAVDVDYL